MYLSGAYASYLNFQSAHRMQCNSGTELQILTTSAWAAAVVAWKKHWTGSQLCVFVCVQEVVAGVIVLMCKEPLQHHGISLSMEGLVNLQLSSKSVGVFEAFYNSVKVNWS